MTRPYTLALRAVDLLEDRVRQLRATNDTDQLADAVARRDRARRQLGDLRRLASEIFARAYGEEV